MRKIDKNEGQALASLVILALIGFFYVRGIHQEIARGENLDQQITAYEESIKPFINIALGAKSFAIFDIDKNEFLYKKNAEEVMPLASLAKVMSAIVILEKVPADHIFTIEKESLSQTGDNGLLLGEKWTRDDLLKFMLIDSSNDAVHQMAKETGKIIDPTAVDPVAVFVGALNARAKDFGYKSMLFYNESGLDVTDNQNGAYANARDISRLFGYAVKTYPDIFSITSHKTVTINSLDKEHVTLNTNPIVEEIPGVISSKTGFTNISGGNLMVALPNKDGDKMVVTVMGSTFDDRFSDVKSLSGVLTQNNVSQ